MAKNIEMKEIDSYLHKDKKRSNNPPVGMAQYDTVAEEIKTYKYDPHISPSLEWAGKNEGNEFDVPTSSIHIHESIKPLKIISSVQKKMQTSGQVNQTPGQLDLFAELGVETPADRMKRRIEAIEFYKHGKEWTNRLIAGDSKIIMNSLIEKEGMAGQVQMVYMDPPYGIKYGSNFQPFVKGQSFFSWDCHHVMY